MPDYDRYAVFGHPIGHSLSPRIHRMFAEQTGQTFMQYGAFDVTAESFEASVRNFVAEGGKGLNCTVPLKQLACGIAGDKSDRASQCKAVNTLIIREDGSLYGDNTDGIGLIRDLRNNLNLVLAGLDILILGAGGASRGILGPVLECGPGSLFVANRTVAKARDLAAEFGRYSNLFAGGNDELEGRKFDLILNATAASLKADLPEMPDDLLKPNAVCYDLAYGHGPTAFVSWGQAQGASISMDGIGMLVEQAAEAFHLWRGIFPDTAPVIKILRDERTS
jgi:shikimate dehydrogenase